VLRRFDRAWHGAFAGLALALPVMMLLIIYQVVGRLVDVGDLAWIEDVCRLILLWVGLLYVPALQWKEEHIAVQFVQPKSAAARRVLAGLRHGAFLVLGLVFAWLGSVNVFRERGMVGAGGMELPLAFFNLVIPICGLLICAVAVVKLAGLFREKR
jgi:TRAP-type C4-dicarboxylate transport system permease small subunit